MDSNSTTNSMYVLVTELLAKSMVYTAAAVYCEYNEDVTVCVQKKKLIYSYSSLVESIVLEYSTIL